MKKFIAPDMDADTAVYWQQLSKHELNLQRCGACGKFRFPPLPSCPHCGQLGGEWLRVSGRGKLHTWTEIIHPLDPRLRDEAPFTMALVELDEGPRIGGRLVGIAADRLHVGMPLIARYDDLDDQLTVVNFQPA